VSSDCHTPKINDVKTIEMGFSDDAKIAEKEAQTAINFLCEKIKSGNTILIHCRKGASRSPHVFASALSIIENRNYNDVYEEIIKLHPRTMSYSIGQEISDLSKNKIDQLFKILKGR
jgi:protein-tyrosine phosphatase